MPTRKSTPTKYEHVREKHLAYHIITSSARSVCEGMSVCVCVLNVSIHQHHCPIKSVSWCECKCCSWCICVYNTLDTTAWMTRHDTIHRGGLRDDELNRCVHAEKRPRRFPTKPAHTVFRELGATVGSASAAAADRHAHGL